MFHICKCLMEQDEQTQDKLEDLGINSQPEWTNLALNYNDINTFWDWVDENDNVVGTIVVTTMGFKFNIDTPFETLVQSIQDNIDSHRYIVDLN